MSMSNISVNKSAIFLAGHDPIMQRIILKSGDKFQRLLAGTVLAKQTISTPTSTISNIVPLETIGSTEETEVSTKTNHEAWAILAKDIDLPENSENSLALAYVHAEVVADQLIFVSNLDEAELTIVYEQLRKNGIFAVA